MIKAQEINYKISIIIVSYKSEKIIEKCLKSIYNTNFKDFEVIIIDSQANSDNTRKIIAKLNLPRLRYFPQKKNVGFALGNNLGNKYAIGKYLLLINPDVVVPRDFVKSLYGEYLKLTDIYKTPVILCPIIKILNGTKHFFSGKTNFLGYSYIPSNYQLENCYKNSRKKEIELETLSRPTDFISGCCFLINKTEFIFLGQLDSSYFMYYEDVYLSFKALAQNYNLRVSKQIEIIHHQKNDYRLNSLKNFFVERNRIRTLLRMSNKPKIMLIKLVLFEPIMLIQSFLFGMAKYRPVIYRDLINFYRKDRSNTKKWEKINFQRFDRTFNGIIEYLTISTPCVKRLIITILNIYGRILYNLN